MVFAERLLSMPKPNSFVFKFLKTKKRNLGDINVPNSKYPQVDSSASSLNPLFPRLLCLDDITIRPDKAPALSHFQLGFLIGAVELLWRQTFLGGPLPAYTSAPLRPLLQTQAPS